MECQSPQPWSAAASNYCFSLPATHEHYPDGDRIFPFATTDKKTIGCLRAELRLYELAEVASGTQSPEMNRNFASLHPSDLPSCFFSGGPRWMSKEKCLKTTPPGNWTEKNRSAVRGATSRCYVGVKRRLDFQQEKGARTGWTMTQYYNLRVDEGMAPDNLVMEEKMILCKVSQEKGKDAGTDMHRHRYQEPLKVETTPSYHLTVPAPVVDIDDSFFEGIIFVDPEHSEAHLEEKTTEYMERLLEGSKPLSECRKECVEQFLEEVSNSNPTVSSIQDGELDGGRAQKSRRKSGVWEHFTRVRTKDPEDVYAICHTCDGMLKAGAKKHGTAQLNRHPCYNRHMQQ